MALAQGSSQEELQAIADAMQAAADDLIIAGRTIISKPSQLGAQVVVDAAPARQYISTRDVSRAPKSFEYVAMQGLAADGGLFVPTEVREYEAPAQWPSRQPHSVAALPLCGMVQFVLV